MDSYIPDPRNALRRERERIARELKAEYGKQLFYVWYAPIKTMNRETSPAQVDFLKRLFPDTLRKVYLTEKLH